MIWAAPVDILTAYLGLIENLLLRSVVFEIFYGRYWTRPFQKYFRGILSLTAVASGFFADSANTYQDLPFEPLKLHLCANALSGRKWKRQSLNLCTVARALEKISPPV